MMNTSQFFSRLRDIFPEKRLLTADVQLLPYESDALTAFKTKPRAVVLPETEQEVIAAVRLCHEMGVPFVARGSGTSLSGGSLPVKDGLVIGLNRLNKIVKLDPQQRIAVVQARSCESAHLPCCRATWLVLCARPLKSTHLHDWWQCGLQFWWGALPQIWDDE